MLRLKVKQFFGKAFGWKPVTDDSGQAALVIITTAIIAAGVALSQLSLDNSNRALDQALKQRASFGKIQAAIEVYAIGDIATGSQDYILPCPAPPGANGVARSHNGSACDTATGDNRGIVPWNTIGLAESDVIDVHGNYITYIVHSTDVGVCNGTSAASDPVTNANGSNVGYALVSHGDNGFGAYNSRSESQVNAGEASTRELDNCPTATGTCTPSATNGYRSGPVDNTEGSTFFDDITLGISFSDTFDRECPVLNEGEDDPLVFVEDSFGDSSGDGSNDDLDVTVASGSAVEASGYFTVTEDVEIATSSSAFNPSVTDLYTSIRWTPTAVGDSGGTNTVRFSIVTRSDTSGAPTSGNDVFLNGITVRFEGSDPTPSSAGSGSISIDILANGVSVTPTTSGSMSVDVNNPDTFELEVYDDGTRVWARITDVSDYSIQFAAYDNSVSTTANAQNNFAYIHNADSGAVSRLDDLLIAKGGIFIELGNIFDTPDPDDSDASIGASNVWSNLPDDTNITVEGWVFAREGLSTNLAAFQSSSSGGAPASMSIRTDPRFAFEPFTGTNFSNTSFDFSRGSWNHFAFTCESGVSRDLVLNGTSIENDSGTCDWLDTGGGVTDTIAFYGLSARTLLSEMRFWSTRQSVAQINSNYQQRADGNESNLYMQYRFDDTFGSTTAVDSETATSTENLTSFDNSAFVGFRSPFVSTAAEICPGNEHPSDDYACVYNASTTLDMPLDVQTLRIKAWGGGGGGTRSGGNGGAGGYAAGIFSTLGTTNVGGSSLNIILGQGGGASGNDQGRGGGGGGGTRIQLNSISALVAAGGGGGGDLAGGAGGGDNGVTGSGTCGGNGASTSGALPGVVLGAGCAVGNPGTGPDPGDGGNSLDGSIGNGGTGSGDGGASGDANSGSDNAGGAGGGGYYGGGAGGEETATGTGGGGGGGSAYAHPDMSSSDLRAGTGTAPYNDPANDRTNACGATTAVGGLNGTPAGNAGNNGCVIVCWSSTCQAGL
ncbi:MAG: hypothetical protein RLN84_02095 [Rhodospirillaceae bacterium]